MATVTHYIRSDYDPEVDRERLQRATGQVVDEQEEDPWRTEVPFGVRRRLAYAPRFVPATLSYDEWGNALTSAESSAARRQYPAPDEVAGWYRSLTRRDPAEKQVSRSSSLPSVETSTHAGPSVSAPSPSAPPRSSKSAASRRGRDWFIDRALAQSSSAPPTPAPPTTLADILSREPPTERPHQPPVFLHLGPSNKGWAMLKSRGWNEGEGLGSGVQRRADLERDPTHNVGDERGRRPRKRTKQEDAEAMSQVPLQHEPVEVPLDDDIVEVKHLPVVDLTLSDSASEYETEEDDDENAVSSSAFPAPRSLQRPVDARERHGTQTALLTPISTVLKSDRLGIGLKAKTEGPHKSSVKRVTHNAAALAAHVKAGEELRRRKQLLGKGKRAFERNERRERQKRKDLMAYLNA